LAPNIQVRVSTSEGKKNLFISPVGEDKSLFLRGKRTRLPILKKSANLFTRNYPRKGLDQRRGAWFRGKGNHPGRDALAGAGTFSKSESKKGVQYRKGFHLENRKEKEQGNLRAKKGSRQPRLRQGKTLSGPPEGKKPNSESFPRQGRAYLLKGRTQRVGSTSIESLGFEGEEEKISKGL